MEQVDLDQHPDELVINFNSEVATNTDPLNVDTPDMSFFASNDQNLLNLSYYSAKDQLGVTSVGPSGFVHEYFQSTVPQETHLLGDSDVVGTNLTIPESNPNQSYSSQPAADLFSEQHSKLQKNKSLRQSRETPVDDTRERPRSSSPSQKQWLLAVRQQLSKRTGIPQSSLSTFCMGSKVNKKRQRTNFQKQNKREVENKGGACYLCIITKRRARLPSSHISNALLTRLTVLWY